MLALAGAGSAMAPTKVNGIVGPGFTIFVKNLRGQVVKTLKPGTYAFLVQDKSNIHSFTIKGPGVNNVGTSVPFVGRKTVTVTLKRGTYTFYCTLHLFKTTVRVG